MDCKTARLLLEFVRPQPTELQASETAALEQHLAGCAECDALARAERQVEAQLGVAMRAVAVPEGLRFRLLNRLERERRAWYRRWAVRAAGGLAAAAAIILAVWFGLSRDQRRPEVDPIEVATAYSYRTQKGEEGVNDWLGEQRSRAKWKGELRAPGQFNYAFLTSCELNNDDRKPVPVLVFTRAVKAGETETVRVLIYSEQDFNVDNLDVSEGDSANRYRKLTDPRYPGLVYLVLMQGAARLEDFFLPNDR